MLATQECTTPWSMTPWSRCSYHERVRRWTYGASVDSSYACACTYYLGAHLYVLSQLVRCIGLHSSTQHQHGVGLDADHEQDDVGRHSSTVTW